MRDPGVSSETSCFVTLGFVSLLLEQVHELHSKHSSEAVKAERWQFEYKNLNDKYEALLKEKEVRH